MDNTDNGTIRENPGEIVALFKTMNELAGLGYEVDWGKRKGILLPTCPLSKNDNNTIKSKRFRALMTKHLGNNGRIPRMTQKYHRSKGSVWFAALHDKYRNENITRGAGSSGMLERCVFHLERDGMMSSHG